MSCAVHAKQAPSQVRFCKLSIVRKCNQPYKIFKDCCFEFEIRVFDMKNICLEH